MDIYDYKTANGKNVILDYLGQLQDREKLKILELRKNIEVNGIYAFEDMNTRQLYTKIWEIKVYKIRLMYVIVDDRAVYFLNICRKQKGKAEKQELQKAINRAKREGLL